MLTKEEAKEYILKQEPIFLQRARNVGMQHSYVCPCCENGAGRDGTGITMVPRTNDHPRYRCFKCGENNDVITLAKQLTNFSFPDTLKFLYDEYGLEVEGYDSSNRKTFVRANTIRPILEEEERAEVDQTAYFERVQASLDPSYLQGRGISEATQRHYHIGTDPAWINPVVEERFLREGRTIYPGMKSPRCIIPTSKTSYLARDTRTIIPEINKKYQKIKYGKVHLFGQSDIQSNTIFAITEGEIDGMSFYEATNGEVKGVGLGSASNWRILINYLASNNIRPDGVLLALDNDEAGIKTKGLIQMSLSALQIPFTTVAYEGKDPNYHLQNNRASFQRAIDVALEELEPTRER